MPDVAAIKALAAARRREPRDVLDVPYIQDPYVPLGAIKWVAVAKEPCSFPEGLTPKIRRDARYRVDQDANPALIEPLDTGDVSHRFRECLEESDALVRALPIGKAGLAFLKDSQPVQPAPASLSDQEGPHGATARRLVDLARHQQRPVVSRQVCAKTRNESDRPCAASYAPAADGVSAS